MSDVTLLARRLAQAEEILNVLDALRPDLPPAELYDLVLQALCSIGGYAAGSLWLYHKPQYRSAAWQGMDRPRSATLSGASFDESEFQHFLSRLELWSGLQWGRWPLPPCTPAPLCPPAGEGHTLIVPLAFTHQVGFAALEASTAQPATEALEALGRCSDTIAAALDTARLFQEHLQMIEHLQRLTEEQRQLQATVLALSAPLLPLLPGVLVLPLIGLIDAARAERILQAELDAIIKQQAAVILVDITGVSVIDTVVARQLIQSAEAARLLGCRTILVGVQPEIAQTLVGLGIDLSGIASYATLADGLQEALRLVHRKLVTIDEPAS
jgi:anti-anti-sigma regulatory factor